MSYQILFCDEDNVRPHEINFLEKYGMLYDFLQNLVTSKINIDDANADQISFVINLIWGYNKNDLFDNETCNKKSIFWEYKVLNKAK